METTTAQIEKPFPFRVVAARKYMQQQGIVSTSSWNDGGTIVMCSSPTPGEREKFKAWVEANKGSFGYRIDYSESQRLGSYNDQKAWAEKDELLEVYLCIHKN